MPSTDDPARTAAKRRYFKLVAAKVPTDANPETEDYGEPEQIGPLFRTPGEANFWYENWPDNVWYPNPVICPAW